MNALSCVLFITNHLIFKEAGPSENELIFIPWLKLSASLKPVIINFIAEIRTDNNVPLVYTIGT